MEILLFIFPLLSFLIFQFFSNKIRADYIHLFNVLLYCITLILSLYVFIKILKLDKDLPLFYYTLLKFDNFFIDWSIRFDLLVSGLIVLIIFIGFILTVYSINLSKNNLLYNKFNSYLSISILSVLILVSSNNLIQFFLAWYLVILSTYMTSNNLVNKFFYV